MYTVHHTKSRKELYPCADQNALRQCDCKETYSGFPFGVFSLS